MKSAKITVILIICAFCSLVLCSCVTSVSKETREDWKSGMNEVYAWSETLAYDWMYWSARIQENLDGVIEAEWLVKELKTIDEIVRDKTEWTYEELGKIDGTRDKLISPVAKAILDKHLPGLGIPINILEFLGL